MLESLPAGRIRAGQAQVGVHEPDEISDGLEAELYALRDKLDVAALEQETA